MADSSPPGGWPEALQRKVLQRRPDAPSDVTDFPPWIDASLHAVSEVERWLGLRGVPMPGGVYHLFAYSDVGGGGIRRTGPAEPPGSNFTVHVADAQEAFDRAVREGAEAILPPERIMPGVTIAVVRAPGGVPVGFSGP